MIFLLLDVTSCDHVCKRACGLENGRETLTVLLQLTIFDCNCSTENVDMMYLI